MQEKPIIFNTEMIKAILDNRKSQTRRVIKSQPVEPRWNGNVWYDAGNDDTLHFVFKCPYGKIGDRLWVRETWWHEKGLYFENAGFMDGTIKQKRDGKIFNIPNWSPLDVMWIKTPSIHMFRWASRINLEITDIRVERVQDISLKDIEAEGIKDNRENFNSIIQITKVKDLWDSINAKKGYGWDSNVWVWVIEFMRIKVNN